MHGASMPLLERARYRLTTFKLDTTALGSLARVGHIALEQNNTDECRLTGRKKIVKEARDRGNIAPFYIVGFLMALGSVSDITMIKSDKTQNRCLLSPAENLSPRTLLLRMSTLLVPLPLDIISGKKSLPFRQSCWSADLAYSVFYGFLFSETIFRLTSLSEVLQRYKCYSCITYWIGVVTFVTFVTPFSEKIFSKKSFSVENTITMHFCLSTSGLRAVVYHLSARQ